MIVSMTLYGLKSRSAEFHANLAETLNEIGFLYTKAYPDMWYRPAVKPNCFEYYKYILCYVGDILCIYHDPGIALRQIQAIFKIKEYQMEKPKIYLGDKVVRNILYGA